MLSTLQSLETRRKGKIVRIGNASGYRRFDQHATQLSQEPRPLSSQPLKRHGGLSPKAAPTLLLAHGSGQPCDSPWMERLTQRLESLGVEVVRFNFEYMKQALAAQKPRPPSRLAKLLEEYRAVLEPYPAGTVFLGGKSLGGRVASHLATQQEVAGLIAFGYPFHPPAKPQTLRTEHLDQILCPTLICQGERDRFGNRQDVESYHLPAFIELCWIADGDHQFVPRKRSSTTLDENLSTAAEAAFHFMTGLGDRRSSV